MVKIGPLWVIGKHHIQDGCSPLSFTISGKWEPCPRVMSTADVVKWAFFILFNDGVCVESVAMAP
jgi:hypothetical protein